MGTRLVEPAGQSQGKSSYRK
ncbi:MAG: hypothetical protein QOG73_2689, partial [Acetobacteraceae bacterium]|nr:hypothetical protein [Acetobacteraceae bacterium]